MALWLPRSPTQFRPTGEVTHETRALVLAVAVASLLMLTRPYSRARFPTLGPARWQASLSGGSNAGTIKSTIQSEPSTSARPSSASLIGRVPRVRERPGGDIRASDIDAKMDKGELLFVVEIPPNFQANILAQRKTEIQINVDATAVAQAGNGANYLKTAISNEVQNFISARGIPGGSPINLVVRADFNPI